MRWVPLLFLSASLFAADADLDWQRLTALDAGPGKAPATPEDALQISLTHLDTQEKAFRGFLAAHPDDSRSFDARLRLARLLALRADLKNQSEPEEAERLLKEAEAIIKTPQQQADFDFATVSRLMRRWQGKRPDEAAKKIILGGVRRFQQAHPKDPRVPALLLEVSTLYEGSAETKEALLHEADRLTQNPGLKAQIADDLRRVAHLGKPLALKFTGIDGKSYDVRSWQGKPVVLLFFAAASQPAREAFRELQEVLQPMGNSVVFAGVSLDAKKEDVAQFLTDRKITIPVAWDGHGWNGAMVQGFGINAVPSAWLIDQEGYVRSLDALADPAGLLKKLR